MSQQNQALQRVSTSSNLSRFSALPPEPVGPGDRKLANFLPVAGDLASSVKHAVDKAVSKSAAATERRLRVIGSFKKHLAAHRVAPSTRRKSISDPTGEHNMTLTLKGGQEVVVVCESFMQHTVTWSEAVSIGQEEDTAVDSLLKGAAAHLGVRPSFKTVVQHVMAPAAFTSSSATTSPFGHADESIVPSEPAPATNLANEVEPALASVPAASGPGQTRLPPPPGLTHEPSKAAAAAALATSQTCYLRPGRCNLYQFPKVSFIDEEGGGTRQPTPSELRALCALVMALLRDESHAYYAREDASGARPIHALLIANNQFSMALCMRLIGLSPMRILDAHGAGMFYGENCMHVLCVNSREAEACELFDEVSSRLPRAEVHRLLRMQASGSFFRSPPVDFYGSTPLSYACIFGMKQLLAKILAWGGPEIDVNDASQFGCQTMGLLPLHCLVASKLPKMVDWLLTLRGHPELVRSRARLSVRVAEGTDPRMHELTPLQLAAKLGDHAMFRFLLKKSAKTDWRWGPMTQKRFNLSEIDSINPGGNNVMELIARPDATELTQEMLGLGPNSKRGNFMKGFMYALYQEKFRSFGKYVFTFLILIDATYLLTLLIVLQYYRNYCTSTPLHLIAPLLAVMAVQLLTEGFITRAWLRNYYSIERMDRTAAKNGWIENSVRGTLGESSAVAFRKFGAEWLCRGGKRLQRLVKTLRRFPWLVLWSVLRDNNIHTKLISIGSSLFACVVLFVLGQRGASEVGRPIFGFTEDVDRAAFQAGWVICAPTELQPDLLSFMLSLAFFCHFIAFAMEAVNMIGVESVGKYVRFLWRMLATIANWLAVFFLLLLLFATTMCYVYPVEAQFRRIPDAIIALWMLATTGEPIEGFPPRWDAMGLEGTPWPSVGLLGTPNGVLFLILYFMWLYVGLILLLNLLIAQMADEFDGLKGKAALEHKLGFARRVLRSELFTAMIFGSTFAERVFRVGNLEPGSDPPTFYFTYIELGKNIEGRSMNKMGEDLFADDSEDNESDYDAGD